MQRESLIKGRPIVRGYTIDDAKTRQRDDGFSIQRNDDGTWLVALSVADVASVVPKDSVLDREAQEAVKRGQYKYLPFELVRDVISLEKGRASPAITFTIKLAADMSILSYDIQKTAFFGEESFTYREHGRAKEDMHSDWKFLARELLCKRQKEQGKALKSAFNKAGFNADVPLSCPSNNASIIEELKYLSRRVCAKYFVAHNLRGFFTLEKPLLQTEKDEKHNLMEQGILDALEESLEKGTAASRLSIEASTPIRRYDDLLMQRILSETMEGRETPYKLKELRSLKEFCRWAYQDRMVFALSADLAKKNAHKANSPPQETNKDQSGRKNPAQKGEDLSRAFKKAARDNDVSSGCIAASVVVNATRQHFNLSAVFDKATGDILGVGIAKNIDVAKDKAYQQALQSLDRFDKPAPDS